MTLPGSVGSDDRLRLFCALPLPGSVRDRFVEWGLEELQGGRLVGRHHLHITLAFLGSRSSADVGAISEALRKATQSVSQPPVLRPARYRETRSVGMLLLDDEERRATLLATAAQSRLEALGLYERETRPWLPHVTVLRFRDRPGLAPSLPDVGAFSPSEAAVYHSVLRPGGAEYEVLESFALGG